MARREFVEALAIMRATLESTTDAILVTDEKAKVIDFNERYIGMWKIPREALESRTLREVWELMSKNFADVGVWMHDRAVVPSLKPGADHDELTRVVADTLISDQLATTDDSTHRYQNVTTRFDHAPQLVYPWSLQWLV